jgi:hypothetical protein
MPGRKTTLNIAGRFPGSQRILFGIPILRPACIMGIKAYGLTICIPNIYEVSNPSPEGLNNC